MAYLLFCGAIALAIVVFLIGITHHTNIAPEVNAAQCCWSPKTSDGSPTRCWPCAPQTPANR